MPSVSAQPMSDLAPLPTASKRPVLLCVDDDRELLEALQEQLRDIVGSQFKVEIAESSDEALEIIADLDREGRELAIVISDQVMPNSKLHGDAFLAELHKSRPHTLKIMLTGQANADNVGNAINNAGLYRFLAKPWDRQDMALTIEEAAKKYTNQRELYEQRRMLDVIEESTQAIASSHGLRELSETLLKLLLEFSGSEQVFLISLRDGILRYEAHYHYRHGYMRLEEALEEASSSFPNAIVRKVVEQKEPLVVEPIEPESVWAKYAYVADHKLHGFVGLPVINQGRLIAVLFLENIDQEPTYTPERVALLKSLASKSTIALSNAYLIDRLEGAVETRNEKLEEAYNNLLALNSHKDKILQIAAHDIRSPLSGVSNLAGLLQDPDNAKNSEQVLKYGGIIANSTQTILNLVNDILDLAKLEGGNVIMNPETVELKAYLTGLLAVHQAQVMTKGVKLHLQGAGELQVSVDKSKMGQAINNLVTNAIKFTPEGGDVIVRYGTTEADGQTWASIEVADTGVGIPAEKLPTLFDKFTKAQRSGTKGEKGTGLGLSIAKEIVEMHRGKITVASDEGQGTTFTILLPL